MKTALFSTIVVLAVPVGGLLGPSSIDPAHKYGWGENIGWTNWQHDAPNAGDGVVVSSTYLAGMIWAENVGWINLGGGGPYANDPADSSTFGVNVDPGSGELFGKAWGQDIGWINFDTRATQGPHDQQARLGVCDNRFHGYAWGENIGWLNLDDAVNYIALGPNCTDGDLACDGIIGLGDFAQFPVAITGPGIVADCPLFDTNGDNDVDLGDFAKVQTAFTGE